ncbi:MAG TPA: hypothetical protein VGN51_19125 [Acidimicrobiia bacterium]|jgi:hypothetical protein
MLNRIAFTAFVAVIVGVGGATAAFADDGFSSVECQQSSAAGCTVTAGSGSSTPASTGGAQPQAGVSGNGTCTDFQGKAAPCTDPVWGFMGSNGCYWKVDADYHPPAFDTADQHAGEAGAWYLVSCTSSSFSGTAGGIVWVPAWSAAPLPAPEVLARQAVNQLSLSGPQVVTSPPPDRMQLVNVPTWLWLDQSAWAPVSATASVPGESVTATATPMSVTWVLGDGSTVVCDGPGTPYQAGGDPTAPSPDCGHTYSRSSAGEPGDVFVVSATVSWGVSWAGGGQSGALPALMTTSSVQLRVGESQAINTNATGG